MVVLPDRQQVGQQLFDHIVEDSAVGGQPLRRQSLDRVMEDEQGSMLYHRILGLDGLDEGWQQLWPLLGYVESGDLTNDDGRLQGYLVNRF